MAYCHSGYLGHTILKVSRLSVCRVLDLRVSKPGPVQIREAFGQAVHRDFGEVAAMLGMKGLGVHRLCLDLNPGVLNRV